MIVPDVRLLHAIECEGLGVHNRLHIIHKQLAMLGYKLMLSERFPVDADAHRADMLLDLGDLMVQVEMLALDLDKDPADLKRLGVQHTYERFQDFKRAGWVRVE
jgi:hypothetical protein